MTNPGLDRAFRSPIGRGIVSIATSLVLASGMFAASEPASVLASACPCSLWSSSTTPTVTGVNDSSAVELGVKFTSDVAGYISGVRFYKNSSNYGQHVGNLWTASGQLLATAKFANETASGWQQVQFADPVPISPNTVYVA
ncbi:MAG TPA: DUF4082 domain-containing protein, partial [Candidatus Limnocylindrales bacterium]|nr:DUF4082 domain-containing protein [Candidatus Limnocylindrales bacterium]